MRRADIRLPRKPLDQLFVTATNVTLEGVTAEFLVVTKIVAPGCSRCVRGKRECAVCGLRLIF